MCLIALDNRQDNTDHLSKEVFERAFEVNSDGVGLMYPDEEGVLRVWRSMKNVDELHKRYVDVRERQLKIAVHFRLTTKGKTTKKNLHPFEIRKGELAFMHNGTVHSVTTMLEEGYSDSWFLGNQVFRRLPKDFLESKIFLKMIDNLIGESRFLFMGGDGSHLIMNPYKQGGTWKLGTSKDGVWFSKGKELSFIVDGKKRTTQFFQHGYGEWGSYPSRVITTTSTTPSEGNKWWMDIVRAELKAENNANSKSPLPDVEDKSWLVFDYGILDTITPSIKDNDLFYCGDASVRGLQLWAVGCKGNAPGMPAALPEKDSFVVHGTYHAIGTADPNKVLKRLDTAYGYDPENPDRSPYIRELREVRVGQYETQEMWVYRYVVPLSEVRHVGIVPNGKWKDWLDGCNQEAAQAPEQPVGNLSVSSLRWGAVDYYTCPLCKDQRTEVFSMFPSDATLGLQHRLYCNTCNNESQIHVEA